MTFFWGGGGDSAHGIALNNMFHDCPINFPNQYIDISLESLFFYNVCPITAGRGDKLS